MIRILLAALTVAGAVSAWSSNAAAQVATASVSTTSTAAEVAPPPPPRPKRRTRRSRRRRRRILAVRPPTPTDREARLVPSPRVAVGATVVEAPVDEDRFQPPLVGRLWNPGWSQAVWAVLWVLAVALLALRGTAWLVRKLATRGVRAAQTVERGWRLIEGLSWIVIAVWVLDRLASGPGLGPAAMAAGGIILVVTLGFNAIRDVVAGLLFNLERPFEIGDYVRVAEAEGQVHAFRTRVVELVAPDGHRLLVPYRALSGTTDVRPGGRRKAHSVRVRFDVPDGIDPTEALALADEVARASPWTTLASEPRITLASDGAKGLDVEVFAFDADAQPLLHAELLKSWSVATRRRQ